MAEKHESRLRGVDLTSPLNRLRAGFVALAVNVRSYLAGGFTLRTLLSAALYTLSAAVRSVARLNDTTPSGPVGGYTLISADASGKLYNNGSPVVTGLSGNQVSLAPFRPNTSVQPWMYVGDSAPAGAVTVTGGFLCSGMVKVRSDGTARKTGIMEPQAPPIVGVNTTSVTQWLTLPANTPPWTNIGGVNPNNSYGGTDTQPPYPTIIETPVAGSTVTLTVTGTATVNGQVLAPGYTGVFSPTSPGYPGNFITTPVIVVFAFTDANGNIVAKATGGGAPPVVGNVGASATLTVPVGAAQLQIGINSQGGTFSANVGSFKIQAVVSTNAITTVASILGLITAYVWGDSSHSRAVATYVWKNPNDSGTGIARSSGSASAVANNNSLILDSSPEDGTVPVQWTTLDSTGASVGTINLFDPALESEGYQDFNACIVGSWWIPAGGTYSIQFQYKDQIMVGIGGGASSTAGRVYGTMGQTVSVINSLPLLFVSTVNGSGTFQTTTISVTFPAAGVYQFEIDWDYWYHSGRSLIVKMAPTAGGAVALIPPLPQGVRTNVQYWYKYRASETGAPSNPSQPSPVQLTPVLANTIMSAYTNDPQVDKVDYYRMDVGLTIPTYVTTGPNDGGNTGAIAITGFTGTGPGTLTFSGPNVLPVGATVTFSGFSGGAAALNGTSIIVIAAGLSNTAFEGVTTVTTSGSSAGVGTPSIIINGVVYNTAVTDTLSDTAAATNPTMDFDDFEPFPSIDTPKSGKVTIIDGVVTWKSGDKFNVRWLPGTVMLIGFPTQQAYSLVARPISTTQIVIPTVADTIGDTTGAGVQYNIAEPKLAQQPLPYMFGPTDNIPYTCAVGDPLRPGTVYWCKGNNLDSAPDTNQQDLTDPSEALVNGDMSGGLAVVFSIKRAWIMVPNFFNALATATGTQGSTWSFRSTEISRGLFIPNCLAVEGGGKIFFRVDDGISISIAGGPDKSITDETLYPLFAHEGSTPTEIVRNGVTIYPPDDTKPQSQQFNIQGPYLYYDYQGTDGTFHTWVFDIGAMGWVWDINSPTATAHASNQGQSVQGVLVGCLDGTIRTLGSTGTESPTATVVTAAVGGVGWNHCYEVTIEYSSAATIALSFIAADTGNGSYAPAPLTLPATAGAITKYTTKVSPNKWRLLQCQFQFTDPTAQIYMDGCAFAIRDWGSTAAYKTVPMFAPHGGEGGQS